MLLLENLHVVCKLLKAENTVSKQQHFAPASMYRVSMVLAHFKLLGKVVRLVIMMIVT